MLPEGRLQEILATKKYPRDGTWDEFWAIVDGALVIFDGGDPPPWVPADTDRDDDGNTPWGADRLAREA